MDDRSDSGSQLRSGVQPRRSSALALAISLMPAVAAGDGFWQIPKHGDLAPGVNVDRPLSINPRVSAAELGPPAVVPLPGLSPRLGLAMRQKNGEPKIDGLSYQATDSLRISADGGIDLDDGTVSGGVKFRFEF